MDLRAVVISKLERCARTKPDAITNIREAIAGYVAALEEDNLPVPDENFDTLLIAV